jgi:hypothetical protein
MMKPAPVPTLEMPQAKFLLQFFIVTLDAPAQFGMANFNKFLGLLARVHF